MMRVCRHSGMVRKDPTRNLEIPGSCFACPGMTVEGLSALINCVYRSSMRQNLGQESLRAFAAGASEEVRLQRVFHDLAAVHEDDAMRHLAGEAHFMGDHHHG